MESTFLLHKPVIYGSALANVFFLGLLLLHIITAAIAPITAIAAFTAKKGSKTHKRAGRFFTGSMLAISFTGIILDIIRLCFFVEENHTKYAGYSMPSTYPARLGFLFVGMCTLYILRETASPHSVSRSHNNTAITTPLPTPTALVATGLALTAIICLRLNPWTGALWMIWTFIFIVILIAKTSPARNHREINVARHRLGTSCLAAFSWWGTLQGFGPAIAIMMTGDDLSTSPYLGNQPGPFSPSFFLFFVGWAPFVILAGYLIYHFSKLRRVTNSPHS